MQHLLVLFVTKSLFLFVTTATSFNLSQKPLVLFVTIATSFICHLRARVARLLLFYCRTQASNASVFYTWQHKKLQCTSFQCKCITKADCNREQKSSMCTIEACALCNIKVCTTYKHVHHWRMCNIQVCATYKHEYHRRMCNIQVCATYKHVYHWRALSC